MAYVQTDATQCTIEIEDAAHLGRIIRGLIADESGAAALYDNIIHSIQNSSYSWMSGVIERLKHIRDEEERHFGSLIQVLTELDSTIADNMAKGAAGE